MEMGAFLLPIAHRFVDHPLVFSREMTYAGCCKDTMPMGQLIDVNYSLLINIAQKGCEGIIRDSGTGRQGLNWPADKII